MLVEQALLDTLSAELGDTLAVICYHVELKYVSTAAEERHLFYDRPIIPTVVFDGMTQVFLEFPPFTEVYRQVVDVARGAPPYFKLLIGDASASQTAGSFNLRIVTADTIPYSDDGIVTFITILEDGLPGFYGTLNHVCRDQFHFPVDLSYPDTLDTTIVFQHSIPVSKMKTVVFVQNLDTKEIMQAIISPFLEE
jgi:hypothetical protein